MPAILWSGWESDFTVTLSLRDAGLRDAYFHPLRDLLERPPFFTQILHKFLSLLDSAFFVSFLPNAAFADVVEFEHSANLRFGSA